MTVQSVINSIVCAVTARFVIAVLLILGTIALLLVGREVPTFLVALDSAAVTFYYSSQIAERSGGAK